MANLGDGLPLIDERVTVAKFLETWLEQVVKPARGYATWQGYEVNVRRHIVPLIGNRTLANLAGNYGPSYGPTITQIAAVGARPG